MSPQSTTPENPNSTHYHMTNQDGEPVTWPVFKTAREAARHLRTAYGQHIAASGYVKSDLPRAACPHCH